MSAQDEDNGKLLNPTQDNIDPLSELRQEVNSSNKDSRKRTIEQVKVYLITYFAYCMVHFQREFWSFSKKAITTEENPEFTKDQLTNLDFAYLMTYTIAIVGSGHLGDIFELRKLLSVAYIAIGVLFILQGLPGFFEFNALAYQYIVMILIGITTSVCYPSYIAIMANWFPKKNRGFFIGLWSTCPNTGNIIGAQLASVLLNAFDQEWGWLLVSIGTLFVLYSAVLFFFLVPEPEQVGIIINDKEGLKEFRRSQVVQEENLHQSQTQEKKHVSFMTALFMPRVLLYALSFFFCKFAVYSILYQLPLFLEEVYNYPNQKIANISTTFDAGAILGSIFLGRLSDLFFHKRAPVGLLAIIFAFVVSVILTILYLDLSLAAFYICMFFEGFFLSALANILSACCSADLGREKCSENSEKATSTITGIIDGTGSFGSAVGDMTTGKISARYGWQKGFLLVLSIDIALIAVPMMKIVVEELKEVAAILRMRRRGKGAEDS